MYFMGTCILLGRYPLEHKNQWHPSLTYRVRGNNIHFILLDPLLSENHLMFGVLLLQFLVWPCRPSSFCRSLRRTVIVIWWWCWFLKIVARAVAWGVANNRPRSSTLGYPIYHGTIVFVVGSSIFWMVKVTSVTKSTMRDNYYEENPWILDLYWLTVHNLLHQSD